MGAIESFAFLEVAKEEDYLAPLNLPLHGMD